MRRPLITLVTVLVTLAGLPAGVEARSGTQHGSASSNPTATGRGGAVATVDRLASQAAIGALRRGANAVDAAVVAAGVLGVTEPFSCGIGGGGFMVIRLADGERVTTVDHRETAPQAYFPEVFLDPQTGEPIPFDEAVTSGLSVGVPGTVLGWEEALRRYGTWSLRRALAPGIRIARTGFVVDEPFAASIEDNLERFRAFTSTRRLFLDNGRPPEIGSVFRNPDLARTYARIAREGSLAFYQGGLARDIVDTVRRPPETRRSDLNVRPGLMTTADLADYEARIRRPTVVSYRGFDVYGMRPPSSGGSTIGEALNSLEGFNMGSVTRARAVHNEIEALKLSFADRNAYIGDTEFVDVPLDGLLSDAYAAERRAVIGRRAAPPPVPPGNPFPFDDDPSDVEPPGVSVRSEAGSSTTHLTVSDRYGNVVSYTFTIEQIGGSGIVVPGAGFLLNNELTDFAFEPPHPNAAEGGKRPRSSMSPTIVTHDERPVLALGSPGGATIISTVLQLIVSHVDFRSSLPEAIVAPRFAELNGLTLGEPDFIASPLGQALQRRGHEFTEVPELGAVAAIRFFRDGRVQAAAEPTRRGGGTALVERPG